MLTTSHFVIDDCSFGNHNGRLVPISTKRSAQTCTEKCVVTWSETSQDLQRTKHHINIARWLHQRLLSEPSDEIGRSALNRLPKHLGWQHCTAQYLHLMNKHGTIDLQLY